MAERSASSSRSQIEPSPLPPLSRASKLHYQAIGMPGSPACAIKWGRAHRTSSVHFLSWYMSYEPELAKGRKT
jgi:hypothetical protein